VVNGTRNQMLLSTTRGKVVGGRRLNSALPCRGNIALSASECGGSCVSAALCQGWTFAADFDCSWMGETNNVGLCYLMGDVSQDAVYDMPADDFVSGWIS
jgi:hypothetical protein